MYRMDWTDYQEYRQFWCIDTIHYDANTLDSEQTFFSAYFDLDDNQDQYQRVVYSFFDMTGQIGGVYEILALAFGLMINVYNKRMFNYSLIESLYYTLKTNDHEETSQSNSTFDNLRSNGSKKVNPKSKEERKFSVTSLQPPSKFSPEIPPNLHQNSTFVQNEMEAYELNEQIWLTETIKDWDMCKISGKQIFYDWFKPWIF